jgi:glycerate-2-kinase
MDKGLRRDGRAGLAGRILEAVARDAVAACAPAEAVRRGVAARPGRLALCGRTLSSEARGRILVVALGKAAAGMLDGFLARALEAGGRRIVQALAVAPHEPPSGPRASGGGPARAGGRKDRVASPRAAGRRPPEPPIVHAPPGARFRLKGTRGDHPVPGRDSFAAGRLAHRLLARAGERDDVVFLVSGGGSSVMAAPLPPFVTPAEKSAVHAALLASGAPIGAMNAVRRHLSAIKGGRLALAARRAASQSTLVLCDVDPERYADVASGPSLPDRSTLDDFVRIVDRYALAPSLPARVLEALRAGRLPETPKPRDPAFRRSRAEMILANKDLRNAAVRAGLGRGLPAEAVFTEIVGDIAGAVETVARAIETAPPGTRLLVLGGEVLTRPAGPGVGGRAQEFALRLARRMAGLGSRPWAFLALGSDGIDGNSPAAGAFADQGTLDRARAAGIDPERALRESDSHRFFHRLGDDLVTGPTGTNVRDLYLLLTGPPEAALRAHDPFRAGSGDRPAWPPESES